MTEDIPDYTEDWRAYWEFRYNNRLSRRLREVASNPVNQFLPIKPSQLRPDSEEYDWSIEIEHLRNYPDIVLEDARTGFAKFVADSEIDIPEDNHDLIPINFTDRFYEISNYFWRSRGEADLEPNIISSLTAPLSESAERSVKPAVTTFECPTGHRTRLPEPIYTNRYIDRCEVEGCTNSVFQISQNTQLREIVWFNVDIGDFDLKCVATGVYNDDRELERRPQEGITLKLIGILRNVIHRDESPERIFEVLSINTS